MKVLLNGLMAENTLDIGIKVNSMAEVSISMQKDKRNTESGNMEKELDGLKTEVKDILIFYS